MADSRPKEHSLRSKHLDNSQCLRHSERLSARERTVATTKVPTGEIRTLRSRDIRPEKREECGMVGRGGQRTKKPTQPPTSPVRVSARLKENTAATIPPLSAKHGRRFSDTDASPYGTRKRTRSLGSNHGSGPSPGEQAFRIATRLREKLSTTRATVTDSDLQHHHHPGTNLRAVVSLQKLECPAKGRVTTTTTTTTDQRKSSTTTSKHNGISGTKLDSSNRLSEDSVLASTCEDRRSGPDKNANRTLQLNCVKREITDSVVENREEKENEKLETTSTLNHRVEEESMEVVQQESETTSKDTANNKTIESAMLQEGEARNTLVDSSERESTNGISTPSQSESGGESVKEEATTTTAIVPSVQKAEVQQNNHQETNSQQDSEDSRMTMDDESQSSHSSANDQNSSASQNSYACKWEQCDQSVGSSSDLADHLSNVHVREEGEKVVCLWQGCRVYNMPARSRSWLSRHVLQHSGDRPFKCMIEGCRAAFASQGGLARHVPTHFVEPNAPKSTPNKKDESPSKSTKRKKTRFRRRGSIVRTEDFFDTRIMDMIRQKLVTFNMMTYVDTVGRGQNVVFRSQVLGRRVEPSGQVKLLLRWIPENVLPDVWVDETELPAHQAKLVPLTSLPAEALISLDSSLYRNISYANFRK